MTEKPAKSPKSVKPGASDEALAAVRKRATRRRKPSPGDIAQRAYFIHLDEGAHDELANWLRAERELMAA